MSKLESTSLQRVESISLGRTELAAYLIENNFLGQREIEDLRTYMKRTNKPFEQAAIERGHLAPQTVETVSLYLKLQKYENLVYIQLNTHNFDYSRRN